jgi:peptidyl-tRNA hydrolase, PTH1 family
MKLIVGLGNPGIKYKNSRHNLGFEIVGSLAEKNALSFKRDVYTESFVAKGDGFILALPQTFMNLSGSSVKALSKKLKLNLADILVVFDDVALELGKLKLLPQGSSGGHQGMNSIINSLEAKNFARLRVGVGIERKVASLSDFVLADFTKLEQKIIKPVMEKAVDCCDDWICSGTDYCMNKYNKRN